MATIITRGAMSAKALGFTGQTVTPVYVEDVFSTYLYRGTGAAQTITNGIDLSTKGGLVWTKSRTLAAEHILIDTVNPNKFLSSNLTAAATSGAQTYYIPSYTTTGYNVAAYNYAEFNQSSYTYASWTFRKQPKFFDIVTYTGDGSSPKIIAHNLGCVPGMIIVKGISGATNWPVYHKSLANTQCLRMDMTDAAITISNFGDTTPTSTNFYVGSNNNASGYTYVAYLFADSNSGGFGLTGSDSVVACGSYSGNGSSSGPTITLGWEPQYILVKNATSSWSWAVVDNMRGLSQTNCQRLLPNTSDAEDSGNFIIPTATGFQLATSNLIFNNSGDTYIYLAIRRGPMKVPTSGTSVFNPTATSASSGTIITTNVTADLSIMKYLGGSDAPRWNDRLRGYANAVGDGSPLIRSDSTDAELPLATGAVAAVGNTGFTVTGTLGGLNSVYYSFRRAPGFMDEVCYTGTGSATTVAHNLGVAPELMIVKARGSSGWNWAVYSASRGNTKAILLNDTGSEYTGITWWNNTSPTSSVFTVGTIGDTNNNGTTFVAYLFATCPGVSKVGSYTGTGAAQNINCGFAAGARFVLIKRTDSTGDWYVYDSARGISSGNDPYLLLNSTAAQVTGTNYVDTFASGFTLTASAPAGLNANGGSYIFLAIA